MWRVNYAANEKIVNVLDLGIIIKTPENEKHWQMLCFIFQPRKKPNLNDTIFSFTL